VHLGNEIVSNRPGYIQGVVLLAAIEDQVAVNGSRDVERASCRAAKRGGQDDCIPMNCPIEVDGIRTGAAKDDDVLVHRAAGCKRDILREKRLQYAVKCRAALDVQYVAVAAIEVDARIAVHGECAGAAQVDGVGASAPANKHVARYRSIGNVQDVRAVTQVGTDALRAQAREINGDSIVLRRKLENDAVGDIGKRAEVRRTVGDREGVGDLVGVGVNGGNREIRHGRRIARDDQASVRDTGRYAGDRAIFQSLNGQATEM